MIQKIAFVGAGSMAEAIFSGVLKQEFLPPERIFVTNKQNSKRLDVLQRTYGIHATHDKQKVIEEAHVIVLSMKPAEIESAVGEIVPYIQREQIIISVAAGLSSDYISSLFPEKNPIIRAMPNTSAMIGYSATAIAKGYHATDAHVQIAKQIFDTIGMTFILDEKDMHAVTAISGSGPAYVYYFVEALEIAAAELNLDLNIAKAMIIQTVIGAGKMLEKTGESAMTLRENVTSPNGTTAAGLEALKNYNFQKAVIECVKQASLRSKQLGKSNE